MDTRSPHRCFSRDVHASPRKRLVVLAIANAAAVATLYLEQALTTNIGASFPGTHFLSLVPTSALAGYATGTAIIAFGPDSLRHSSIQFHLWFLVGSLLLAAIAPDLQILIVASFCVGAGAAVAQRLLAECARLAGPALAGSTIGKVICGSLAAILGIKLLGEYVGAILGWRTVFLAAAGVVSLQAFLASVTTEPRERRRPAISHNGNMFTLWRTHPLLRRAGLQQALLFGAYNASWMTVLVEVPFADRFPIVLIGCGAGLLAALTAGRLMDSPAKRITAAVGAGTVAFATLLVIPIGYSASLKPLQTVILIMGVAAVEAGMQTALVANQARVQGLSPSSRTQLASTLTMCGFLGGAIGTGTGFWLWQTLGWKAETCLAAAAGSLGLAISIIYDLGPWRGRQVREADVLLTISPIEPSEVL